MVKDSVGELTLALALSVTFKTMPGNTPTTVGVPLTAQPDTLIPAGRLPDCKVQV